MKNLISFTGCNYFARPCNFHTPGFGEGASASRDHFRPAETYRERFANMVADIAPLGFDAYDIWEAQLDCRWATLEHIMATRDVLKEHNLIPAALAMSVGPKPRDFERACWFANLLGVSTIIAWDTVALDADRAAITGILRDHKVRYTLENHPEKTPGEILAKLGKGDEDVVGVALDTGWFGTQGYPAEKAIRELNDRIMVVHLKDVLKVGAHNNCAWGDGIVDIQASVEAIREIGYQGSITIEMEPYGYDPTPAITANLKKLKHWML